MASAAFSYTEKSDIFSESEIFDSVGVNDIKRTRELLDCGIDINIQDFDKGWTPLHVAASRGSKQGLYHFFFFTFSLYLKKNIF